MKEATRGMEYTTEPSLYLAFELSKEKWKLGFSTGLGQRPRRRTIDAGDLLALQQEIDWAEKRFHLPADIPVKSCYEAGRDGFWLHRYLVEAKVENLVVDSSSIKVDRRAKRGGELEMRLHLILPRVEPEEIKVPAECSYEDCDGTHFQFWQAVEKPLRDTKHSRVVAHRYQCLRSMRTHRVYPKGVSQDHIS